ncbi:DnaD domain-containing protein [Sharpea azabuensis]|uniref:DNA replication protein n=1 Tax=Sharpea azabuensis TaxID=322505 RepID=A0A1H6R3K8_9FIRM|nr:DnaD domain protein [Sharpea azabuensis]SEI49026.1 DNA replication protein [Sharpea azabuensis]
MNNILIDYNCIDFHKLLFLKGKQIGLSDQESYILNIMLLLHEQGVSLLTPQMIAKYCTSDMKAIDQAMLKFVNERYLDRHNGILDFKPLYRRLLDEKVEEVNQVNLIERFEDAFGRPLSQTEIEIINSFKRDGYDDQMIVDALLEAVRSNVLNFRYIEKILSNWARYGKKMRNKPIENTTNEAFSDEVKNLEWWKV